MSFDDPLFDDMAAEIRRLKVENAELRSNLVALCHAADIASAQLRRLADHVR